MRARPSIISLVLLWGCGSDGRQPQAPPAPLAAPVWEAPLQVAEAGPGYGIGPRIGYLYGGPLQLAVDAAGNAFLGSGYAAPADPPANPSIRWVEAWGNAWRVGQGWGTAVRLSAETGIAYDWPSGLGLTPDGALFGWAPTYGGGLRGLDLRSGWLPPGTLLSIAGRARVSQMTTDAHGTPALVYVEQDRVWLVRHTGTLQAPEPVFDSGQPSAFVADGSGALAVATFQGGLAVRLPDGRWQRTALPSASGSRVWTVVLAGRPDGGFVASWIEKGADAPDVYAAAEVDAGGNPGPRVLLGSLQPPAVAAPALLGPSYNPPRLVAGAGPRAAVAWRDASELLVARQNGGSWGPTQAVPGAAVAGAHSATGARLPFDLALDGTGTLLLAWTRADGTLVSAQHGLGQAWSPTSLMATGAADPLLAMNAGGTAFAAWRDGQRVMAARSPRR